MENNIKELESDVDKLLQKDLSNIPLIELESLIDSLSEKVDISQNYIINLTKDEENN